MGDLPYAPIVPNGIGGNHGTKAVPAYVMAEAETAPLPKITVDDPPPPPPAGRRSLPSRLGDLPMRVIYRIVAGVVAVLAVATASVVVFLTGRHTPATGGPSGAESLATLPGATSGPLSPGPSQDAPQASAAPSDSVAAAPSAPSASSEPVPSSSPSSGSATPSGAPTVTATPTPSGALLLAQADPRVHGLPADRKLADFPGKGGPTKGKVKDERSGVTFARFVKGWKLVKSSPFATRLALPGGKGAVTRGLLASCPVPITVQDNLKDTAFLAARWSLKYHPAGATIAWTASQSIKVGKRDGWLLGYRVAYKVHGKRHTSTAAVALVDVLTAKPALVLITVPDTQKKHRSDINSLVSSLHAL